MENEEEIWLPIPGFPAYDVSNLGNVRSYYRRDLSVARTSFILCPDPQHTLAPAANNRGYKVVHLAKDKKEYQYGVAYLVLLAFVGPRPKGYHTCHNDGNPANNTLSNLRYDTPKGNMADKPTEKRGRKSERPLSREDIIMMRNERADGATVTSLARKYGIKRARTSQICTGRVYPHIPGPLTSKQHAKKLDEATILAIRRRRANHESPHKLANEYGVSRDLIFDICSGKKYAEYGGPLTTGHVATKWTKDIVLKIRGLRARGASLIELANTFHTCPTNISRICTGERHPEFGGPITQPWQTIIR